MDEHREVDREGHNDAELAPHAKAAGAEVDEVVGPMVQHREEQRPRPTCRAAIQELPAAEIARKMRMPTPRTLRPPAPQQPVYLFISDVCVACPSSWGMEDGENDCRADQWFPVPEV